MPSPLKEMPITNSKNGSLLENKRLSKATPENR